MMDASLLLRLFLGTLLPSALLPLLIAVGLRYGMGEQLWAHAGLHALVEALVGFMGLFVAVVIKLLHRNQQVNGRLLWLCAGLVLSIPLMALHTAPGSDENVVIWLYALATLLGGGVSAGMLLGEQWHSQPRLPYAALLIALGLMGWAMFFPEHIPDMGQWSQLSDLAVGMNLIGALGFVLAWFALISGHVVSGRRAPLLLGNFSLLMASAAIIFLLADTWDSRWWFYHFLRLAALALLLSYFFALYLKDFRVLRENDARFQALVESIHAGVYRTQVTLERRLVYASAQMHQVAGLSMQQCQEGGVSLKSLVVPEDWPHVQEALEWSIKTHVPYEMQYRINHPQRGEMWVSDRGRIIKDHQGQPCWFDGALLNIHEARETEQQLLLAKQVVQTASEAIVITNHKNQIMDVNPAYERITGFMRHEVLGRNPKITQSGRHDASFYATMWKHLVGEGHWSGEIWDRRRNGEIFPKWLAISAIRNRQGVISHFVGVFNDISRQKSTEQQLERLVFYDPLTQLPNRVLFRDRLIHEVGVAERSNKLMSLLLVDLDRFKIINDTLGHGVGDELLLQVSKRLIASVRKSDTVARLGGDEFAIILPGMERAEDAAHVAETIINQLQVPFSIEENELFVGASIGIAVHGQDGDDYDSLTMNADAAMFKAKESGKGTYKFFTPDMNIQNAKRLVMEAELRRAVDNQELMLHYQPKVDAESRQIVGMEALVRWVHPTRGVIPPGEFIPLAEETGLIVPLGELVLTRACAQVKQWWDMGLPQVQVAVNLSPRQFQEPNLIEKVSEILRKTGFPATGLELEITESIAMHDVDNTIETVKKLKDLGVRISIDDFGTGYSSLSYLKKFPLHALKIDQSFVRDLGGDDDGASIISSIISMAKAMALGVVAEGVETAQQMEFLRGQECQQVQGFFLSKPLPPSDFLALLERQQETGCAVTDVMGGKAIT
ncbi:diguanylate cyclase/phosphodiesterase with PAS/PAC sensor(s) [Magnetococcus marinus MC-1]|uniref:Diguanylate cyclase/phosphodiesterase with PAS/PAC sensor(S) n=1 Tax=Magnetococcus marinus (strain ATCC BAA-1437 / JCM 17883 / MC-1) TaxID=156889 RepID=A0LAF7_MAGMM|nr:GGDEF domain-containing phosphodiesterase [Magnetococcus marinus]ABK44950.1 diguanylate cyclase/phosphodiesterase with PAS/PAC sensor(s) [Magnetococcus marinus MC-1]